MTLLSPSFTTSMFEIISLCRTPYYKDLIRVFYSSLKVTKLGNHYIEIKMKHLDWLITTNLKY